MKGIKYEKEETGLGDGVDLESGLRRDAEGEGQGMGGRGETDWRWEG